jgi:hypothetical protein
LAAATVKSTIAMNMLFPFDGDAETTRLFAAAPPPASQVYALSGQNACNCRR